MGDDDDDQNHEEVGPIAGALSRIEYAAGLAAAGFTGVSVSFTHQVGDGLHSAIIKATKPTDADSATSVTLRPAGRLCRWPLAPAAGELGAAGGAAMADPSLTGPSLDPAARRVINAYLAELADRLGGPSPVRVAILAELEDGLWTATTPPSSLQACRRRMSWLLLAAATWRWAGREPSAALGLVAGLVGLVLVVAVPAAVRRLPSRVACPAGCRSPGGGDGEWGAAQPGRTGGTPLSGRPRDADLTGSSRRLARARRIRGTPTMLGRSQ